MNVKCKNYIRYNLLNLIGTESNGRASPSTLSKEFGWWCISPEINPTIQKVFKKINPNSFQTFRIIPKVFKHLSNSSNLTSAELLSFRSSPVLGWGGVGRVVRVSNEPAYLIQFNLIHIFNL